MLARCFWIQFSLIGLVLIGCSAITEEDSNDHDASGTSTSTSSGTDTTSTETTSSTTNQASGGAGGSVTTATGSAGEGGGGVVPVLYKVQFKDKNGKNVDALLLHPKPGQTLPGVIYNHGGYIEEYGYEASKNEYNLDDFAYAIADAGYVAFVPIRPQGAKVSDGIAAGALSYVAGLVGVDPQNIHMISFSKGGSHAIAAAPPKNVRSLMMMSPFMSPNAYAKVDLSTVAFPIFLTLGTEDLAGVMSTCKQSFMPQLQALNKDLTFKEYPGDHASFRKVRLQDQWPDVINFINQHAQ